MPNTQRSPRLPRPPRKDRGTIQAQGATFAQLTHERGTAEPLTKPKSPGPLGPNAPAKFGAFDTTVQGWIALALSKPQIAQRVRASHASGAELAVAGYWLARGYTEGRDLFFQEYKFLINSRTRKSSKRFIVDDAINSPWGQLIYLNIDGVEYHDRTELEEFKDQIRDGTLAPRGRVVDVPDRACFTAADLTSFFALKQVP